MDGDKHARGKVDGIVLQDADKWIGNGGRVVGDPWMDQWEEIYLSEQTCR